MTKPVILSSIRELRNFMDTSFLEPYCGLYKVRKIENKDPEGCMYIRLAAEKFFDQQFEDFKQLINQLHREIND